MSWALKRQILFALSGLIFVGLLGFFLYTVYVYEAPSCFDNIQNQNEGGIDCGGPCALLCEAPNITSLWARSIPIAPGVYHVGALVQNPDTQARGRVRYEITLFDRENILITRREGMLDIDPGEIRPLFEPNITVGERIPSTTFINFEAQEFFTTDEKKSSSVRVRGWNFDPETQRLIAEIVNQGGTTVFETQVTAFLFNDEGTLVSASQTLTGPLVPNERASVTFTWQSPFTEPVSRVDIFPRPLETN